MSEVLMYAGILTGFLSSLYATTPVVAGLLVLRVRIPPGAWMCLSFECCVVPGREVFASGWLLVQKSPTVCGVSECDDLTIKRPCPARGWCAVGKKSCYTVIKRQCQVEELKCRPTQIVYRCADKSLARPGRKQAAPVKSVTGRGMDWFG